MLHRKNSYEHRNFTDVPCKCHTYKACLSDHITYTVSIAGKSLTGVGSYRAGAASVVDLYGAHPYKPNPQNGKNKYTLAPLHLNPVKS